MVKSTLPLMFKLRCDDCLKYVFDTTTRNDKVNFARQLSLHIKYSLACERG